jgi:hypothetical protein
MTLIHINNEIKPNLINDLRESSSKYQEYISYKQIMSTYVLNDVCTYILRFEKLDLF